jgi:hypothetical protein
VWESRTATAGVAGAVHAVVAEQTQVPLSRAGVLRRREGRVLLCPSKRPLLIGRLIFVRHPHLFCRAQVVTVAVVCG